MTAMKLSEDSRQEPGSRNDWADAPYEVYCLRYNRATGKVMKTVARSEEEAEEFFDYSKDYLDPNPES